MKWGGKGSRDGQLNWPVGITMDSSGHVYVADSNNDRVQKFSPDGKFLIKLGGEGSGDGQFNWPEDVAVDSFGNIYVSDIYNHRVQKFNPDGKFLIKLGGGRIDYPFEITPDSSGHVYVSGADNDRARNFSRLGSIPKTIKQGETMKINLKPTGPGKVTVRVFALSGRLLWKQSKNVTDASDYINWAYKNSKGGAVASGAYIVYVKGPGLDTKKKVTVLR